MHELKVKEENRAITFLQNLSEKACLIYPWLGGNKPGRSISNRVSYPSTPCLVGTEEKHTMRMGNTGAKFGGEVCSCPKCINCCYSIGRNYGI